MAWLSRRAFQEAVDHAVRERVEAAVKEALARQKPDATPALLQAIEGLFTKQLESFGRNTEAMGGFLGAIAELSMRRAAVALGSRGGRQRALNERARQAARAGITECEVCVNPLATNQAAIIRHVQEGHDRRRSAAYAAEQQARNEHGNFVAQNSTSAPPIRPAPAPGAVVAPPAPRGN